MPTSKFLTPSMSSTFKTSHGELDETGRPRHRADDERWCRRQSLGWGHGASRIWLAAGTSCSRSQLWKGTQDLVLNVFSSLSHSGSRHPNRTIRFLATKDSKEILCFPKVGFSDCIHSDSPCLFAVSYPILIPCLSVILSRSFASVYYPLEFSGKL